MFMEELGKGLNLRASIMSFCHPWLIFIMAFSCTHLKEEFLPIKRSANSFRDSNSKPLEWEGSRVEDPFRGGI
jgi:hypothetical protein